MASEQIGVITIISLICISIYLKFFKRVSLPLWYYLGIGFFIAGFLCLYLSPGHHARASTDAFKTSFLPVTNKHKEPKTISPTHNLLIISKPA